MTPNYPLLSKLSWSEIQQIYSVISAQLQAYAVVSQRIKFPRANVQYSDDANIFLLRWHNDIKKLDSRLGALDREIARRQQLIGVMG